MRKSCLLLIIGVTLALVTSCKKKSVDNPQVPYPGDVMTLPYTETFDNHFGTYTTYNVEGEQEWVIDYETAKMAGSVQDESGAYINYANEDWLISSPISIGNIEHAKMVMTYIGCYFNDINKDIHVMASTDYSGSNIRSAATWNDLNARLVGSSNWDTWNTIELSLDAYVGKTVYVAVRYISNTDKAGTIEIKSISVEEGEAGGGPAPSGDVQSLPYYQEFSSDFGTYITKDVLGEQSWMIDFSTAKMTGYVGGTNYANEDWLISSPVAITDVEHAMIEMSYIARYFKNLNNDLTFWASKNYEYDEMPETADWTQLSATLSEGSNWNDFLTAQISLDDYIGDTINIAVKYVSTDEKAGTIEIKTLTIAEGQAGGGGGGQGGETQNMPYTQDFSSEFGTYITKDVLGPQSWAIDFQTAKMTGYVSGTNNANEDWLISSPVEVTGVEHAKMVITYIGRYFNNINEDVTIWASSNYNYGDEPSTARWSQIPAVMTEGSNWNDFLTTELSLDEFIGQTVTVAVKYISTEVRAGTIEIKSISVEEGEAGGVTPTPPTPGPGGEVQNMPYAQSFATEFGSYTTYDVAGSESWMIDFSTAKMTGYVGGTNYANEDWLISSPVSITGVSDAKMTMVYIGRYFNNINDDITIWASTNYSWNSNPTTASWNQVPATLVENSNWNDFKTAEISLTEYVGQTVTLAVKYLSNDVKAGTIEIQSITIEEGSGVTPPPTPPTPGPGTGSGTADDPYNVASGISLQGQNIIGWVQGYIVGVVKNGTSTVTSNADVNWSAPFDSYTNVVIADDANCTEIANCVIVNLPSGKPLREQVNLFDNPDNYGKLLSVNGKLRTYFGQAGLRDSGGTENDFVLEGGVTPPPTPPTPGGDIFSESFASGQGDFTIQDVNLPEGLTYVWQYASNYSCMKASAYVGQAYETESWLVSPAIDLSNVSTATLTFEQAVNYASPNGALFMMISTDYNGDVTTATWTELNLSAWPAGSNWSFVSSTADLSQYAGQNVTIAFKYTSSTSASATWEVKNFVVSE